MRAGISQQVTLLVFILDHRVEGSGQNTDFIVGNIDKKAVFILFGRDVLHMIGKPHQGTGKTTRYQPDYQHA